MRELFPRNAQIDFLSKAKFAYILSSLILIFGAYLWVEQGEAKFGIDYVGGSEYVVKLASKPGSEEIRSALSAGGITNAVVQSFEIGSDQYSIRLRESDEPKLLREKVSSALTGKFGADSMQILSSDVVGPSIGKELQRQSLIATLIALVGILLYIAFRFEFSYALGAVVATFHDVGVCFTFYLLSGHEMSTATLAAALTILGYSVNDTIVIFDRVREERRKRKHEELRTLMNEALNMTLSRTIITNLLTLFSAAALLVWGGGGIADLSLFLFVGIITGSYSTIYIASPVALAWENFREARAARRPVPTT